MEFTREGPVKITIKTIERAWRNRAKDTRHIITDAECPGLMLIVNAKSMTWAYSYKPRGRNPVTGKRFNTKPFPLGSPASYSPDQARAEANRLKDEVRDGGDPAAARMARIAEAAKKRASTVEKAVETYVATLPEKEKKSGGRISQTWAREQADHLRRAVTALGVAKAPLDEIDVKTMKQIVKGEAARHRFGAFDRFLAWCVHEGLLAANPCASISRAYRPGAGGKRERTPMLAELATLWKAASDLNRGWRDFVRFLICLPARRNEVANLRWEHIDFKSATWTLPGKMTKNREQHALFLHPLALDLLHARYEAAGRPKAGLVFPSPRAGMPIVAFSAIQRGINRAAPGLESWSFHDLRRSFASALGAAGVPEAVADAILNHKQSASRPGVMGVYQKASRFPEQVAAMRRWGFMLGEAIEGRTGDAAIIPFAAPTA